MTTRRKPPVTAPATYEQALRKRLRSKRYCVGYLEAAALEGTAVFRRAVKDIAAVWLPRSAAVVVLAVGLAGCVTIPGSCVETGGYQTRCYSTQYTSSCWSGPERVCRHRWLWEPDPEEERMAAVYKQIFGKAINEE